MDSEIDYSKLTPGELKILISVDDLGALEEYTRRVKSGDIKTKFHSTYEAGEIVSRILQFQVNSEKIDYKNLTDRELRHLMQVHDPKADDEYDRRIKSGKIKLRRVTFEDIEKMYGIDKSA